MVFQRHIEERGAFDGEGNVTDMRQIGFGIIGCGVISRWHADSVSKIEGCKLIGGTDVSPKSREAFAEKYGVTAFESVEALLACSEVDVVCICTPSGLHAPLCIAAAEAGKHIITEKPMALTVADCDAIIEATDRCGVKIEVISQLRFSHTVQSVRAAVLNGTLGRIVSGDIFMI